MDLTNANSVDEAADRQQVKCRLLKSEINQKIQDFFKKMIF